MQQCGQVGIHQNLRNTSASTQQLGFGSDGAQNSGTSFLSLAKGSKRLRSYYHLEPIKRDQGTEQVKQDRGTETIKQEHSDKPDDDDSVTFMFDNIKTEIV